MNTAKIDPIARKVALEGLRTAYEKLLTVTGGNIIDCEAIGSARGHVIWALGVLGTDADREYVRVKTAELDAFLDDGRAQA